MCNRNKIFFLFLILVFANFFFNCKKEVATLDFEGYPTEIGKIMTYKCATSGCHNNASYQAAANLNLTSYANMFKGANSGSAVIPFRSDFSTLCGFINTYDDLGLKNLPTMPLNADKLSYNDVKRIKHWIDNGAPDINGNVMWSDDVLRRKYYVVNQGCDLVTVFDASTQLAIRCINVGNNSTAEVPHMVKVSPDGEFWYVIFVNSNMIQKYRTTDDVLVGQVALNAGSNTVLNWNTLTITNDSKKAYCVSFQSNGSVAAVDLTQMKLLHFYSGSSYPYAHGSALNKTNDTLYITTQFGNYINKVDTGFTITPIQITLDGSLIPTAAPLLDPHEIIFSDDGTKYFVTCQKSNEVRVMQTSGDLLLATIPTGQFPSEMVKSDIRNKLYVTCTDEPNSIISIKGAVSVIDMNNYSAQKYAVGYQPHGIIVDETNNLLVVTNRNLLPTGPTPHHTSICGRNGFVNYFNINTMQLLNKKTEVSADPYSIAIRP